MNQETVDFTASWSSLALVVQQKWYWLRLMHLFIRPKYLLLCCLCVRSIANTVPLTDAIQASFYNLYQSVLFISSARVADVWQTLLPAASVFCISLQSDVVFACDVTGHLQALTSCCCFAQHLAFHYILQQWVMLQDVPHAYEFALSYCVQGAFVVFGLYAKLRHSLPFQPSFFLQTHISNTNCLSLSACVLVHVSAAVPIQYTKTLLMFTE